MENNFLAIRDFSFEKSTELYMTFSLSDKDYAIPAKQIIEIVQLPALNVLEKVPEYIVGVMNLRGKIISVIDLRKFLGISQTAYSTEHQIMIIDTHDKIIGIIVDSVNDVIQFDKKLLEPLPYQSIDKFLCGIYKDSETLVAFLDLDVLFSNIQAVPIEEIEFKAPVYSGTDLFPKDDISQAKFKKRAINLQKELKVDLDRDNYHENRFVSFCLNDEIYCISLKHVKEFSKLKHVSLTPIPCVPEYIMGLINLRGEFMTIIDIKSFLQIPKSRATEKTKIIVVRSSDLQIGLVVDEVFDIVNISNERLSRSASAKFEKNKYTSAEVMLDGGGVMSVFDLERFLEDDRLIVEDAV